MLPPELLDRLDETVDRSAIAVRVDAICRAVAARWPGLQVSMDDFVAHLAHQLPRDEPLPEALARVHASDLYLAFSCAAGDAHAIHAFFAEYGDSIASQLSRMRIPTAARADLEQDLRIGLFVSRADRPPLVKDYAGRGTLRSWLRAVVVHAALKAKRKLHSGAASGGGPRADSTPLFSTAMAVSGGPEVAFMKTTYGAAFEHAFATAMATIDGTDRTLLRQRFLDGLNIDELAVLYHAHRATVARRLVRARGRVLEETRRALCDGAGLSASDFTSILRLIRSELDMSISRHFAELPDAAP